MDWGLLAFGIVAVIGAAGWALARQRQLIGLDAFVTMVADVVNSPQLTAVQKRHDAEAIYRRHAGAAVSLVGALEDVYPNRAVVMQTGSRQFPRVGFDIQRISAERLRALSKGRSVTLRGKLPKWNGVPEIESLPELLRDTKVFCGGKWYPVKRVFVARVASKAQAETKKGMATS